MQDKKSLLAFDKFIHNCVNEYCDENNLTREKIKSNNSKEIHYICLEILDHVLQVYDEDYIEKAPERFYKINIFYPGYNPKLLEERIKWSERFKEIFEDIGIEYNDFSDRTQYDILWNLKMPSRYKRWV